MKKPSTKSSFLLQDAAIILLSILMALILVKTDILVKILTSTKEFEVLGTFIAGMFFTSIFTTAPAIVTLGEIAKTNSILLTATIGALGSVTGDVIIFRFVRDRLSEHLLEIFKHQHAGKRISAMLKHRSFRWLTFLIGGLIIASPLPDELGISFLGFSKMKMSRFIPLSFVCNFIGIVVIGLVATAL